MRLPISIIAICCLTGCAGAPLSRLVPSVPTPMTGPAEDAAGLRELEAPAAAPAWPPAHSRAAIPTARPQAARTAGALPSANSGVASDARGPGKPSVQSGLDSLFARREPARPRSIQRAGYDAAADLALADDSGQSEPDWPASHGETPTISLAELESMAAAHNPTLQTAAAIVQKAMGVRRQVGRLPNPTLAYMGEEMGDDHTWGMQGAFVTQTFVTGDKLEWNERVASGDVQVLRWQAETQRYRVRNDVRRAFFVTLGAQEKVKLALELEQIADDGVRTAQALLDALQAARPDLLQAEIQLNEVEILRRNAEYEHEAAWRNLANLVGVPTLPLATIDHPLDEDRPERDAATLQQHLLSASPQLQQARAEVQRAQARIGRERSQVIPNLNLQVGTMYMSVADNTAANVQLGVPLPIFNRNEGNIDQAAAEYHRAAWNIQRLELQLQSELAAAWSDYQQARNRVATFREEILPREQRTLELIQIGYPIQFDFLRVLTARRSYFEARIDYLDALVDLRQAEVLLDGLLLTGGLDPLPDPNIDDGLRGRALSGQ